MGHNSKFNTSSSPVVLICPLDWGLGHATRCIPLIHEFKKNGCTVIIGAGKHTYSLLKQEFPDLQFLPFPGYDIKYSRSKYMLIPVLLFQIPKILRRMQSEGKLLHKYIEDHKISIVISDNRFALHSPKAVCVYITHQLRILSSNRLISKIATAVHSRFISRFNLCWVPDFEEDRLAGKMSSSNNVRLPVQYLGPLSRFKKLKGAVKFKVCISISGPEPQRTLFEKLVLKQISSVNENVILIRGLPAQRSTLTHNFPNLQVYNHLPTAELNAVFEQSHIIISRSGYTTVMDLIQLQKRAVLIPTPGQYEQEYLAKNLQNKKYFLYRDQQQFSLSEVLNAVETFDFMPLPDPSEKYKEVISLFLKTGST